MLESRACFYWSVKANTVNNNFFVQSTKMIDQVLISSCSGRFIFLGSGSQGDGLLAYNASRNSVEGTACALREELKPFGVSVVTLDSAGVPAESLFKSPIPFSK